MPYKEAIRVLDGIRDEGGWTNSAYNSLTLAINALEMRRPRKPIKTHESVIKYCKAWKCPNCDLEWSGGIVYFCYRCGQAIDWSENE